jgi:hypothetical protein
MARRTGREPDDPEVRTIAGAIFGVILATALPMLVKGEVEIDDLFTTIDRGLAQLETGLRL